MDIQSQVNSHYGNDDIYVRIINALAEAGIDSANPTVEDLAPIDQFHPGGLGATKSLAGKVEISPRTRILDAGCGVGGLARFLAKTYGCSVVGIDLAESFVSAAGRLNDLLGLSEKVTVSVGDITDTGFEDESFDLVWSQNVLMNIEDKAAALRETHRVLKRGGSFLVQVMTKGEAGELDYPVMWASGPDMDFRCTSEEFKRIAVEAGLKVVSWEDVTRAPATPTVPPPVSPADPPPASMNYGVIMDFPDFAAARKNTGRASEAGKTPRAVGVLRK